MVAEGSGGVFNGMTYTDDIGQLKTGRDYILNRLALADGHDFILLYWNIPRGTRSGYPCKKPDGAGESLRV